mgnify:CR=1 FL=1
MINEYVVFNCFITSILEFRVYVVQPLEDFGIVSDLLNEIVYVEDKAHLPLLVAPLDELLWRHRNSISEMFGQNEG